MAYSDYDDEDEAPSVAALVVDEAPTPKAPSYTDFASPLKDGELQGPAMRNPLPPGVPPPQNMATVDPSQAPQEPEKPKKLTGDDIRSKLTDSPTLPNGAPNVLSTDYHDQLSKHFMEELDSGNISGYQAFKFMKTVATSREHALNNLSTYIKNAQDIDVKDGNIETAQMKAAEAKQDFFANRAYAINKAYESGGQEAASFELAFGNKAAPSSLQMDPSMILDPKKRELLKEMAKHAPAARDQEKHDTDMDYKRSATEKNDRDKRAAAAAEPLPGEEGKIDILDPKTGLVKPDTAKTWKATAQAYELGQKAMPWLDKMIDAAKDAPESGLSNKLSDVATFVPFLKGKQTNAREVLETGTNQALSMLASIDPRAKGAPSNADIKGLKEILNDPTKSASVKIDAIKTIRDSINRMNADYEEDWGTLTKRSQEKLQGQGAAAGPRKRDKEEPKTVADVVSGGRDEVAEMEEELRRRRGGR